MEIIKLIFRTIFGEKRKDDSVRPIKTLPAKEAKRLWEEQHSEVGKQLIEGLKEAIEMERKEKLSETVSRPVNKLIVHVADTPDSMDIGVKEIREWHLKQGWSDVGYHFVIRRDGTLEKGRPMSIVGSHVKGQNTGSIGICWVGRDNLSPEQKETLIWLLKALCEKFKLASKDVYGHKEFDSSKTCPNLDMNALRSSI